MNTEQYNADKLKDLTNEDIAAGMSNLEQDSQREAAEQFDQINESDIDKSVDSIKEMSESEVEEQNRKEAEGKQIDEALEKAKDAAEE